MPTRDRRSDHTENPVKTDAPLRSKLYGRGLGKAGGEGAGTSCGAEFTYFFFGRAIIHLGLIIP
jgi:hypothetical protein